MNRLLVVRCPDLLDEDEGGAVHRTFVEVVTAVEAYCPWVTIVGPGICSLPSRGPARYFGGEEALVRLVAGAAAGITPVEVGVADGLFAATLAAGGGWVVPPGGTTHFLAPFPVGILGRPELAELLDRLGIRTLGDFAALPESHVLGRFGVDGALCHQVAGGRRSELGEPEQSTGGRRAGRPRSPKQYSSGQHTGGAVGPPAGQSGFWGGVSDTDARAGRALTAVQDLVGPDGVVTARLQGGRSPSSQARFVTWNAKAVEADPPTAPWPGRIPPPAPAVVHPSPLRSELADSTGASVSVSGRGLLTADPYRLSVEGDPWTAVVAWAGPWPSDERWWSRSHRRSARLQVVTREGAHLLYVERDRWWVEATYG